MIKTHRFEVHGGQVENPDRPGKCQWPDHMHIVIPRFHARELAKRLLDFLDSGDDEYTFSTMGELEIDVPEE